ncbi:MAG: sugar phosphate isomerase/epimerase family protein [Terriglobia bacterium]
MKQDVANQTLNRRSFITRTGAAIGGISAAAVPGQAAPPDDATRRKFYTILSLSRLGFKSDFRQSVSLAHEYGFEGIDPDAALFASLSYNDLRRLLDDLASKKLKFGAAGLPVNFRKDTAKFNQGLSALPAAAQALQRAGVARVSTYVMPCSNELTYLQNFRQHASRLRECAKILADHGQTFGLEYVATRTVWRSERQPFIHTLSELRELEVAIGADNLGVQLDSWHWYNAEETAADIENLRGRDVVTVDLNDAPRLPLDDQRDNHRELPAATGVIPVRQFLQALVSIRYEGPIQAEPFNAQLRAMPVDQAVAATAAAIRKAFAEANLA